MSMLKQVKIEYENNKYRQLFTKYETNGLPQRSPVRDTLDDLIELTIARTSALCASVVLTDGSHHQPLSCGHKREPTFESSSVSDIEFAWIGEGRKDWSNWIWLFRQTIDVDASSDVATDQVFLVSDLTTNEHTMGHSFPSVTGSPLTFYAGMPIISSKGVNIGSVFILAGSDRTRLSKADVDALAITSKRCTNLLELARESGFNNRWARIERELDAFILSRSLRAPLLQDQRGLVVPGQTNSESNNAAEGPFIGLNYPIVDGDETKRLVDAEIKRDARISQDAQDDSERMPGGGDETDDDHGEGRAYRRVFKKAAKCVQRSFEADGVVFVDGHSGFHGALQPVPEPSLELGREAVEGSPVYESENYNNNSSYRKNERTYSSPEYRKGTDLKHPAEVLGSFIQTVGPDLKRLPYAIDALSKIDELMLQKLMDTFPDGSVWYIKEGEIARVKGETLVAEETTDIMQCLLSTFPFAQQLILKSLIDPTSLKRLAVCLVWKNTAKPLYTDKVDLPSLNEFLHVVESEVARYDATAVVKQQGAFVSSVSHELRTPLHGILGAVQLLGDTDLEPLQQSLLQTINSCGSTLHETLTSVLSYAQINQFERRQHQFRNSSSQSSEWALAGKRGIFPGPDREYKNLYIETNLALLCEEIVGVLDAGQSFYRSDDGEGIIVVLNIDYQENWCFDTEPGAMRRIAANLIGNALKYTTKGTVTITLKSQQIIVDSRIASNDLSTGRTIQLAIEDTGKGISEHFLENHLFNPFTQEDATSSQGVGLGMSIVKSLVSLLSGEIQVHSEVGVGSNFVVRIPMEMSHKDDVREGAPTTEMDSMITRIRKRCLRIVIFGFPEFIRASIEMYLRDWCHCDLKEATDDAGPHVVIFDECKEDIREEVESSGQKYGANAVLLSIVLNPKKLATPGEKITGYTKWNRIPRPLGPNSIAAGLLACIEKLDELCEDEDENDGNIDSTASHQSAHDETAQEKEKEREPVASLDHSSHESLPVRSKRSSISSYTSPPSHSSLNVLLVDDNALNLRLLNAFLKKNGYQKTQKAENGAVAVEAVKNSDGGFEIIFMDLSMPILSGFDATRQIREFEASRQDPTSPKPPIIIALTGLASVKDHEDAFNAGVDMFLTKPMQFAELGATLRKCEDWILNAGTTDGKKNG